MVQRRAVLAGLCAAGLAPAQSWADAGDPAYLSAAMRPDGTAVLCGLNRLGARLFARPLPARGHAAAAHPTRPEAVAFARRPGTFALVVNCLDGTTKTRLALPRGHHFYGHGAFSGDGDLLFTTENAIETARGMIGVWDTRRGYRRVGAFSSGGIGPHDIQCLPDGQTLAVANGGIETHPETGRLKLNIPTMRPNLSYVAPDGGILEQVTLDAAYRKNSLRHLAIAGDGAVAFALQWQGDPGTHPPLLGFHRQGGRVRLAAAAPDTVRRLSGYVGSLAVSDVENAVAITSPRGGVVQIFGLADGGFRRQAALPDVCGVAGGPGGFLVTNGLGQTVQNPTAARAHVVEHAVQWDNHLVALRGRRAA